MENQANNYEPGIDQNQGVVGTMARNQQHVDAGEEGTQVPDVDPNLAANAVNETDTDRPGERGYSNDEEID